MKLNEDIKHKNLKEIYEKKIKSVEDMLIEKKLGATVKDGGYNYEFMTMMNHTKNLLSLTKPLSDHKNEDIPTDNNNLTVGDV